MNSTWSCLLRYKQIHRFRCKHQSQFSIQEALHVNHECETQVLFAWNSRYFMQFVKTAIDQLAKMMETSGSRKGTLK